MSLEEIAKHRPERESQEEIILKSGETKARVLLKGATVNQWTVGETEVLYPYQTIQADKESKIRGGIPILFPIAGPPEKTGLSAKLSQHGFAREMLWSKFNLSLGENKTILSLYANEKTRRIYPFEFGLSVQITIEEGLLKYEFSVANNGKEKSMPFILGLHPYFQVSPEEIQGIKTNIPGFKSNEEKLKEVLFFDWQKEVQIEIPRKGLITMSPSPEFKKLVVWTDGKGPYICFEPWVGGVGAIDRPKECISLLPKKDTTLSMELRFQPSS